MALAGLFIDQRALMAVGRSLATVPLLRGHESDRAVAVLMHGPVHECFRQLAVTHRNATVQENSSLFDLMLSCTSAS